MSKASNAALALSIVALLLAGVTAWRSLEHSPQKAKAQDHSAEHEAHLGPTMTRVQGIYADLYFAGQAQNWALAAYHIEELEETLKEVPSIKSEENGVTLKPLIDVLAQSAIPAIESAIERKDLGVFLNRFTDLASSCNACHAQTGHPYLVVQTPDAPATRVLNRAP